MTTAPLPPALQQAVSEFDDWWNALREREDLSGAVAAPLYHYTDGNGLKGILTDGAVWLTSILHLNDPSEFAYGVGLATKHLTERCGSENPVAQIMIQEILNRVGMVLPRLAFYVAGFSLRGDDLGQWRAYGANGRGYALGIAPHLFKRRTRADPSSTPPNETIFVSRVIYEEASATLRQKTAIDEAVRIVERCRSAGHLNVDDSVLQSFLRAMAIKLFVPLIWNSITTKHSAYSNEQEMRLILVNEPTTLAPYIKTRVRGSEIVPYVPDLMDLKTAGSIAQIVVGPAADYPRARHGAEQLLRSLGIDPENVISQSQIPYRG
jgi:hypothetical protein